MSQQSIIDSHVHLWPESMSNEESHRWMTPGMPLARPHLLEDYHKASGPDTLVEGIVYVETDARYDTPGHDLSIWAHGPLNEIRFLRTIVDGECGERDAALLKGIVLWAPMDQPTSVVKKWLDLALATAGERMWERVKGFRFLLQGITDPEQFTRLHGILVDHLRWIGKMQFSFDIVVDQHSAGVWQLEAALEVMIKAHEKVPEEEKVIFVLNHLCKPDFANTGPDFERWRVAINGMAKCSRTYMKLSGAFSELPAGLKSVDEIVECLRPWLTHVFRCFGPERIMFGSDWPVCNIKGSWDAWREVVAAVLDDAAGGLSAMARERVWRGTAAEAYRLQ